MPSSITVDITLDANTSYVVNGRLFVKNNATLTIPAGIIMSFVKNNLCADKSVMVITQGSKLLVNGTANKPVVFTSAASIKAPADWVQ